MKSFKASNLAISKLVPGIVVLIIVLSVVIGIMAYSQLSSSNAVSNPTPTPQHTTTPSPVPTLTPAPTPTAKPELEPIIISGEGQDVTSYFVLEEGIAVFAMNHDGNSNFIIKLYSESGELEAILVNEIGSYSGSLIVGVGDFLYDAYPGRHKLEVNADGNWQVTITPPRPTTASKIPVTFTGSGSTVPTPFRLEIGLVEFEITHYGFSKFIIRLYSSEGELVDILVNEIGDFEGSVLLGVTGSAFDASPGIYYLSIRADGDWAVKIDSP